MLSLPVEDKRDQLIQTSVERVKAPHAAGYHRRWGHGLRQAARPGLETAGDAPRRAAALCAHSRCGPDGLPGHVGTI